MTEHNKTFHLHGGKTFSDLKGLAKELKDMGDEVFSHHVNEFKNDFAAWMNHSLNEEKLASKIEKTINKIELELEVLRHLVHNAKEVVAKKKVELKKAETKVEVHSKAVEAPKKVVRKTPAKKVVAKN